MHKYAQILWNKAHWIFETEETLDELKKRFTSDVVFVEITPLNPQPCEGWDYDGKAFSDPNMISIDLCKANKLQELNEAANRAYVSGFSSAASGTSLWYDSDIDTQNVINRQFLIALSNPAVYSTTQFFVGVPVGVTPVRARPQQTDPDSEKTIQLLNASQMIQLGNDLAVAWASIKSTLWGLQAKVYAAARQKEIDTISWSRGG